jgi:hypothetical protein
VADSTAAVTPAHLHGPDILFTPPDADRGDGVEAVGA